MQGIIDLGVESSFFSIEYLVLTQSALKARQIGAGKKDLPKGHWTNIENLCFQAELRQPFFDAYFSMQPLFFKRILEAVFWFSVTVIGGIYSLKITRSWTLTQKALIQAISNFVCQLIALAGLFNPRWGVSCWQNLTRQGFQLLEDKKRVEMEANLKKYIEEIKALPQAVPSPGS